MFADDDLGGDVGDDLNDDLGGDVGDDSGGVQVRDDSGGVQSAGRVAWLKQLAGPAEWVGSWGLGACARRGALTGEVGRCVIRSGTRIWARP